MIIIKQIKINAKTIYSKETSKILIHRICHLLKISVTDIYSFKILKEAIDARKKPEIFYIYNCVITVPEKLQNKILKFKKYGNVTVESYEEIKYNFPCRYKESEERPIVIGSGPAGLFATYFLSIYGYRPIMIERGSCVSERKKKIENFFETGKLDEKTNIQFGEGGAGTFSDGKLNTGTKDKAGIHNLVLETFVKHGANPKILYENKPHIGTDVLEKIVVSMRNKIISNGGTVLFDSILSDINIKEKKIESIVINDSEVISCKNVILAIGHSARDTFRLLNKRNVKMCTKPFAIGVRVVHKQSFINQAQYGCDNEYLPAADYKIATHTKEGKSVYSFCMCPGGYVVPAASGATQTVVNGMSYSKRDGLFANSAMLVNVDTNDFHSSDLFSGMEFQEMLEKKAYELGQGYTLIQSGKAFLNNYDVDDEDINEIADLSVKGKVIKGNIRKILPEVLSDNLCEGIILADRKFKGFSENIKLVAGLETRTSSPLKILRNEDFESNINGLYPCGEGAGYAGGIMSAAVDGIKVAAALANKLNGEI